MITEEPRRRSHRKHLHWFQPPLSLIKTTNSWNTSIRKRVEKEIKVLEESLSQDTQNNKFEIHRRWSNSKARNIVSMEVGEDRKQYSDNLCISVKISIWQMSLSSKPIIDYPKPKFFKFKTPKGKPTRKPSKVVNKKIGKIREIQMSFLFYLSSWLLCPIYLCCLKKKKI